MRAWLLAGVVGLVGAGPAGAFYFPGWPADGLPRGPVLLGPAVQVRPWAEPGDRPDPPPPPPPPTRLNPPPAGVPEPAAFALAVAGVGAVAGQRTQNEKRKTKK